MSKKKQEKIDEQFFVGIQEPMDLRRNILESSREVIHTLQSYEKVQAIREEKLRRLRQFKTVIEELKYLVSKLSGSLPKVQVREVSPDEKIKEPVKVMKAKEQRVIPKKKDVGIVELKKLEEELSAIEGKLSQLG